LKCSIDNTEPVSFFLDIIELNDTTGQGITDALLECLNSHGLTKSILRECLVAMGTDGGSSMFGKNLGVQTRLKSIFPNLISWHCLNHRLKLCVNDAVKTCSAVNHFKSFMTTLYALYSASPKNRRALEKVVAELGVQLHKIGRVLDVRWSASSFRAVKAVWSSYAAIHGHFVEASNDQELDGRERAKFSGLAKKLSSAVFLRNLALLYDALQELGDLSESLQAASITIHKAHRLINRQAEVFTSRKETGGPFYKIATVASETLLFQNINLTHGSTKEAEIRCEQFYQCLVDAMQRRMLPDSEKVLVDAVSTLLPTKWSNNLSPEYGEEQLLYICEKFLLFYNGDVKQGYRDYKDSEGEVSTPAMRVILNAIATLPISTAACERGFSKMNIVCTPLRSCLSVKHMSSLLFISMVGPPLTLWQPINYVKSWMLKGRRNADSATCPSRQTPTNDNHVNKSLWSLL